MYLTELSSPGTKLDFFGKRPK